MWSNTRTNPLLPERAAPEGWDGQLGRPPARGTDSGMEHDDLLCSRNARPQKALAGERTHPDARATLNAWFTIVRKTDYASFTGLRKTFPSADQVDQFTGRFQVPSATGE